MGWFSAVIEQRKFRVWALAAVLVVTMAALAGGIATGTTTTCSNPATLSGSAFEIDNDANLVVNTPQLYRLAHRRNRHQYARRCAGEER